MSIKGQRTFQTLGNGRVKIGRHLAPQPRVWIEASSNWRRDYAEMTPEMAYEMADALQDAAQTVQEEQAKLKAKAEEKT